MSVQLGDKLFIELGHGAMASGKDKFVDLVDEAYDDESVNQLIVFFSMERSDVDQLIDSFQIMDFDAVSCARLSALTGYEMNNSNYFMALETVVDDSSDESCD